MRVLTLKFTKETGEQRIYSALNIGRFWILFSAAGKVVLPKIFRGLDRLSSYTMRDAEHEFSKLRG